MPVHLHFPSLHPGGEFRSRGAIEAERWCCELSVWASAVRGTSAGRE
jgi:hypothetical protein